MAPKVFLTENTGYIGDSLFSIAQAHPDWRFPVLVRNKEKAAKLASEYSQARVVDGDLDLADVIEEEVKNVDKVYHFADCDHEFSTKAIAKVVAYHTPPPPPHPQNLMWLIHTAGTGILTVEDFRSKHLGIKCTQKYYNWNRVNELLNLPNGAPHHNVNKVIIRASQRS